MSELWRQLCTHGRRSDLTRPEERRKVHMFGADDVVVLGVPVYYGRVPEVPAAGRPTGERLGGAAGCVWQPAH